MNNNSAISNLESALIVGDLTFMSDGDRIQYYSRVCESLGLNPLTKPFSYLKADGKLTLYANKDGAAQLRDLKKVSIVACTTKIENDICIVEVTVELPDGRRDCDMGCVPVAGLSGNALGNALMKAVTKAKRRATLSICGLGWLDESEIGFVAEAESQLMQRGKVKAATPNPKLSAAATSGQDLKLRATVDQIVKDLGLRYSQTQTALMSNFQKDHLDYLSDTQLVDFSNYLDAYRRCSEKLRAGGWTPTEGQEFLKENFQKESRLDLTLSEITEFVNFLEESAQQ